MLGSVDKTTGVSTRALVAMILLGTRVTTAQPCFGEHVVAEDADTVLGVHAADINGDGFVDILAAVKRSNMVAWYRSDGGCPPSFELQAIDAGATEAVSVFAADLDGDLDLDVIAALQGPDNVIWYENDGALTPSFSPHVIDSTLDGASGVHAADMDGDGFADILAAGLFDNRVVWYENRMPDGDGGADGFGGARELTHNARGARSVVAADVDGDSDLDVLSASKDDDTIAWYENRLLEGDSGADGFGDACVISSSEFRAQCVFAADLDGDGDPDAVVAVGGANRVTWYENRLSDGDSGPCGFAGVRVISSQALDARSVFAADLDGDLDLDVLSASADDNTVAWYENDGAVPPGFTPHVISTSAESASGVFAAHLNCDSTNDVIAVSSFDDTVAWYENGATVTNTRTSAVYSRLEVAITDAVTGDTLLAEPGQFGCGCTPDLDYLGKAITVECDGTLMREGASSTTLAPGAQLVAVGGKLWVAGILRMADGSQVASDVDDVVITGSLEIPGGASSELSGDAVELRGSVQVGAGAELLAPDLVMATQAVFSPRSVWQAAGGVNAVVAADLDDDEDWDVLSAGAAGTVSLHESNGGSPPSFTVRTIATGGFECVFVADLDGDGDRDVVAGGGEVVAWQENVGGLPLGFIDHPVAHDLNLVRSVSAADIDGDGSIDLLSASQDGTLAWYRSDGSVSPLFEKQVITTTASGVRSLCTGDFNGDGNIDVLAALLGENAVAWYEHDGAMPPALPSFTRRDMTTPATLAIGAQSVFAADVDGDGDLDALSASWIDNKVAWYENDGAGPLTLPSFTKRVVSDKVRAARSVYAADIDGDGDIDIVSASTVDELVVLFENQGGGSPTFVPRAIGPSTAQSVFAADLDGDGDKDVVTASPGDASIHWYENILVPSIVLDAPGSAIRAATSAAIDNHAAVTVNVGAELEAGTQLSVMAGSALLGSGTVRSPMLSSAGLLRPAVGGSLTIDGGYEQFMGGLLAQPGVASGTLLSTIGGDSMLPSVAHVAITGAASLSGGLRVEFEPEFVPMPDHLANLELLVADSITGSFDVALFPNLPGTNRFLTYTIVPGSLRGAGARAGASVLLQVKSLTGDVTFEDPSTASAPTGAPVAAALADMDRVLDPDGHFTQDLVIALPDHNSPTTVSGSVVVLFNAGTTGGVWNGFIGSVQFTTGVNPSAVAVADLGGGSTPDIVVANRGTPGNVSADTITVLIDPPSDGSPPAQTVPLDVGDEPRAVALEDLDFDGLIDIGVVNAGSSDSLLVYWNLGSSGAWNGATMDDEEIELPDEPTSLRPGDFDAGTIIPFFAITCIGDDSVAIVGNDGARDLWLEATLPVDSGPVQVLVENLDDDALPEIVTVNTISNTVSVLVNTSTPGAVSFQPSVDLPVADTQVNPRSIAAGDFDDDGDPDLAVVTENDAGTVRIVRILRNDLFGGQLAFVLAEEQDPLNDPLLVLAGDLNGDDKDDVVTVSESSSKAIQSAAATSSRDASTPLRAAGSPGPLAHRTERAHHGGVRALGDVSVLLATPPPASCPGDINGDGATDVFDFSIFASNFGQSVAPGTNGDLDGNGYVDVFDFGIFASGFGCHVVAK